MAKTNKTATATKTATPVIDADLVEGGSTGAEGGERKRASVFIRPAFLSPGDVIKGTYDALIMEVGKYKKPVMFLTLTAPFTYGDEKNPVRTYDVGESVGLGFAGNLMYKLNESGAEAGMGTRINVLYEGKKTIEDEGHEFAGEAAHTFKVFAPRKAGSGGSAPASSSVLPD